MATSPPPAPHRRPAPPGARARAVRRRSHPAALRGPRQPGSSARSARCRACFTSRWTSRSTGRRTGSGRSAFPRSCCSAFRPRRTRSARRTSPRTASSSGPSAGCASAHPDLLLITDVCCCEYTSHGHCGILRDGTVDNDATLEILGRVAVSHAAAGADIVAPSGMMDGMVAAIRAALDAAGHQDRAILSYAVKYASAFYGPFREAADSAPAFGDRRQYQMDPANVREATARGGAGRGRGRRPADGEAGAGLPRRGARGAGADPPAAGGLQRERRVRDGEGGGASGAGSTSGGWCSRR